MKKGERIVFLGSILARGLRHLQHLTIGKVYIVSENYNDDKIWLIDDNGCEMGFGVRTYIFEKLSVYRKKKLEKLNTL
jgi:hypothetical protein